ncbi:hypothetical protein CHI09_18470, partial [Shouchella clausii]
MTHLKNLKVSLEEKHNENLLTIDERLDYYESRNMAFKLMSKQEAKEFMTNNTYLYKISFYKDNFY